NTSCLYELLHPLQVRREVFDLQFRNEIVSFRKVANCPEQASRRSFRTSLHSELHLPLLAFAIARVELRIGTLGVFFFELNRELRLAFFSAGAVEQIARRDVAGISPNQRGLALRGCGSPVLG